jgi:hypothetical protein
MAVTSRVTREHKAARIVPSEFVVADMPWIGDSFTGQSVRIFQHTDDKALVVVSKFISHRYWIATPNCVDPNHHTDYNWKLEKTSFLFSHEILLDIVQQPPVYTINAPLRYNLPNGDTLMPGDAFSVKTGVVTHFGIYLGPWKTEQQCPSSFMEKKSEAEWKIMDAKYAHDTPIMVHYWATNASKKSTAIIRVGNFRRWRRNYQEATIKKIKRTASQRPFSEVMVRAFANVGRSEYNLLNCNCEHFVNWVCFDMDTASQIARAGQYLVDLQPRHGALRTTFSAIVLVKMFTKILIILSGGKVLLILVPGMAIHYYLPIVLAKLGASLITKSSRPCPVSFAENL